MVVLDYVGGAPVEVTADATIRLAAAQSNTLDMNLFFVGLDGYDSEAAKNDEAFQALLDNVGQIYAEAGISLGQKNYIDVTGDDGDRLGIIDTTEKPEDELWALFELSGTQPNRAVNLFLVADIASKREGFSLAGISGGAPGPALAVGTPRSGVAVNMENFLEARDSGEQMQVEEARRLTEMIFAHEMGHYLGLYHTTESNGQALDPEGITGTDHLEDTPICLIRPTYQGLLV